MASDSLERIPKKKSKLAGKPGKQCGKTKSLFGEFGTTLRGFLTMSFVRDSSRQRNDTGRRDYKEEQKEETTKTGVKVYQTDEAGTGDGPRIQEPSDVDEIVATIDSIKPVVGELRSTMNDFQTYSSRLLSTNADQKDYKEEEKGEAKAGVEVWQADEAGTGDGPRTQEHSNLDEINAEAYGVKSVFEELGSTLKDFGRNSFIRKSLQKWSDACQKYCNKEEENKEETTDEAGTGDGPGIQEPSYLAEISATRDSIKVQVDFFDLVLIARSFASKTSGTSSQSGSLTFGVRQGVRQGSVRGPHLFNLYIAPLSLLSKAPSAEYNLYADDIQLFISFFPNLSADSIDHIRMITQYCSW